MVGGEQDRAEERETETEDDLELVSLVARPHRGLDKDGAVTGAHCAEHTLLQLKERTELKSWSQSLKIGQVTSNCETRSPDWVDTILNLGCGVFCAEQDLDPKDVYLVLKDLEASLS